MVEAEEVRVARCATALLELHDLSVRPGQVRIVRWTDRLGALGWLLAPVVIGHGLVQFLSSARVVLADDSVEDLCAALPNSDPESVSENVRTISVQLMLLDRRVELPWRERANLRAFDPSQIEAAAEALVRFYFTREGGRDPLLQATQEAATEVMEASSDFRRLSRRERRRRYQGVPTPNLSDSEVARSRADARFFAAWQQWAARARPA